MTLPGTGDCFRCGEPGHWQDNCPLLKPAATEDEHLGRINLYIDRWAAGKMTREQKRVAISLENKMWHGDNTRRALSYP